jgi:hypothetical protein
MWQSVSTPLNAEEAKLVCPACETASFDTRAINDVHVYQCSTCKGAFLRKGTLEALGTLSFSADQEAPGRVGRAVGAGLLADLGFSVVLSLFL